MIQNGSVQKTSMILQGYVISDKSGQFPPEVRHMCGYHTLMHTNYLEAQTTIREMKDSYIHEQSDALQRLELLGAFQEIIFT